MLTRMTRVLKNRVFKNEREVHHRRQKKQLQPIKFWNFLGMGLIFFGLIKKWI